jgi:hypothetical protein
MILVPYRCFIPVCQSTKFSGLFSTICTAIAVKLCTWLYIYVLQIEFEDGCYRPIFGRVMPLKRIISFPDLFFLWLQIFIWYLVHCFAIPRYRSSLSLVSIHWFFSEVMALGLRKISQIISFPDFFFSLLIDIHLIFVTLPCHTKIQIKFEFGFDLLIFPEIIALELRKISRIISFPDLFSLCLQIFI